MLSLGFPTISLQTLKSYIIIKCIDHEYGRSRKQEYGEYIKNWIYRKELLLSLEFDQIIFEVLFFDGTVLTATIMHWGANKLSVHQSFYHQIVGMCKM